MKRLLRLLGFCSLLLAFRAGAGAPAIITPPRSVTNNYASAADFIVVATNAASYQWVFNATNTLVGATNATLSLDDVTNAQAGSYTVVVSSSDNISVTSAPPAVLTIEPGTVVQFTISKYPNGGSNSFTVALFDHDKPATVENFIHYISYGAYSNMFFDRCVPDFVLQGGSYVTYDRTNTANQLHGEAISSESIVSTGFPAQVDSEFGVGPLVHNTSNTIAMAMGSSSNSATSAFFFNLVDNSTNLDTNTGGFTVFGRVVSNAYVLQYFNTLSAPSNGIFDLDQNIPTLPVNYNGTNAPANLNLFYCDFTFISPTNPPVDTNPPTVSITFPLPNAVFTNGSSLTVQGTAWDNVGLAEVFCELTALAGIYEGDRLTNAAVGATNWSLDLVGLIGTIQPGVYELTAFAQDGAGNLSAPDTEYFTNLVRLTIITNLNGTLATNAPQYLMPGQTYSLTNAPVAGLQFYSWQNGGVVSIDPVETFTAETNFTLEVTYVSTNLPPGLTISSPAAGSQAQTANGTLTLTGTLPITVTNVSCQLFSHSTAVTSNLSATISGTNWSLTVSNLAGLYTLEVVAIDSFGISGSLSETFTALVAPPTILSQPASLTVNAGSAAYFSVTASNAASYQWQFGASPIAGATSSTLALDDVSTNQSGFYSVVVTSPDGRTTNSQPAGLTVRQGTIVEFTLSRYADGSSNSFTVELFDQDKPATVENFIHYITSGAYSNMFFDVCVPGFFLQGGDYVTFDRTNTAPGILREAISSEAVVATGFPPQVDSEFGVGPLVHNTSNTIAMALGPTSNSASSAFFFNLADNSANLDTNTGGFTVFGRVVSNASVLQHFNTLSAPSNGINYDITDGLTSLPVNYSGTNRPNDASLFYCDLKFISPTNPPKDTTPPTVSVDFPPLNAVFTNGAPLTVTGTASDNIALAEVFCILTPLTGANAGKGQTNAAVGTTSWSLTSTAGTGVYQLTTFAQDGAGNLSAPDSRYFTNMARVTIITNADGQLTTNQPLYAVPGVPLSFQSAPGPGEQFYSWATGGQTSLNPVENITPNSDVTLTVTYYSPNPSGGLAITSPASGSQAIVVDSVFPISGTLPSTAAQLECQFFLNSNYVSTERITNFNGTNWSLTVTNLGNGACTVLAQASSAAGGSVFAETGFSILNRRLTINVVGGGTVVSNPGPYALPGTYTVNEKPNSGQVFYGWNDGTTVTLNPSKTFTIVSNITLTAMFITNDTSLNGFSFTYPPANAKLTNLTFNMEGRLSESITQLTCQLFLQSNSVTAAPQFTSNDFAAGKWTLPVADLAPGPYTALAMAHDNKGRTRLVRENFNLLKKLVVGIQPPKAGGVSASLSGKYLEVGKSYTISATPGRGQIFAFWTGPVASSLSAKTTFVMSSNTQLTANFTNNPFPALAGTYTGLFMDPSNPTPTNSGFVTLTTTGTGVFSGRMMFPSRTYSILWRFLYNGLAVLPSAKGFDSNGLDLVLSLDLTNADGIISGYVADETSWTNLLVLYRAADRLTGANAPAAGRYALLFQPENDTNGPVAEGYASLSLGSGGVLSLGGSLADNSAISQSARLSKEGIWPLYMVPSSYQRKGMIIGWQIITSSNTCASIGPLFWFKPAGGAAANLTATGAKFAPPPANGEFEMVLPGGSTNSLPVKKAGQFSAVAPIVGITLLPTGVLSGSIETNNQRRPFKGVFISPSAGGGGLILDSNGGTEGFEILPKP